MQTSSPRTPRAAPARSGLRHLALAYLRRFLPVFLLALVMALAVEHLLERAHLRRIETEESAALRRKRDRAQTLVEQSVKDTLFLADLVSFQMHAQSPEAARNELAAHFKAFARRQGIQHDIRLYDHQLREILHATPQGLQPADQADPKSGEAFSFLPDILGMPQDALFISPFELEMTAADANGTTPSLVPTLVLRLATPVRLPGEQKRGVVVLSLSGAALLEILQQTGVTRGSFLMARESGHWLVAPDPALEWGHMLPERAHLTVDAHDPALWAGLTATERGQFRLRGDLVTFLTIPRRSTMLKSAPLMRDESAGHLKYFTIIPASELTPPWRGLYWALIVGVEGLLAVIMLAFTRARLAQAAVEHERQRGALQLQAMSDASHDALVCVDAEGTVIFWNRAAQRLFGWTEAEILGKNLHDFVSPQEYRPKIDQGLRVFQRTGQGPAVGTVQEFIARRKDGSIFPVERSLASYQLDGQWYAIGSARDITERKEAQRQLELMATTDALTGLMNRRRFLELAEAERQRGLRYRHPVCCIMLDVDHFKKVNDTYGHAAGDAVLKALAAVLRQHLRAVDVAGRLGGEEFAVLLPESDLAAARVVAEKLRLSLAETEVVADAGLIRFTASMGLASLTPAMRGVDDLLKAADAALYAAKQGGRNRVVEATPQDDQPGRTDATPA